MAVPDSKKEGIAVNITQLLILLNSNMLANTALVFPVPVMTSIL